MRQEVDIHAVREDALREILEAYGLADKLDNGVLSCPETGVRLTWDNLGSIKVIDGKLVLYSVGAEDVVLGYAETG